MQHTPLSKFLCRPFGVMLLVVDVFTFLSIKNAPRNDYTEPPTRSGNNDEQTDLFGR